MPITKFLQTGLVAGLTVVLYGCGSGSSPSPTESGNQAKQSDITIAGSQPGVTPFIASVQFAGQSISGLTSVEFTIAPQTGSVSAPVDVTWTTSALSSRGYLKNTSLNLPVFGLYQAYQNQVSFQLTFADGSTQQIPYAIPTTAYTDPTGIYLNPTIIKARAAGSSLGFNFFLLKSTVASPVIADTDGQLRWIILASPSPTSTSVYFANGEFVIGGAQYPTVTSLQMDGTQSMLPTNLPLPLLAQFSHNIDPGPNGLLAEFTGSDDLGQSTDATVAEFAPTSGQPPFQTYDLAEILSSYMRANGDDPTAFVRPGVDWFHGNASVYDPSDNTVIVSSRENFLIKLGYSTHQIVWIFGDPTKYWYTFPSLRAKALTLANGGDYPIGQHAVSFTSEGYLMIFNDGYGSVNQPAGEPEGLTRSYSETNAYTIDTAKMTAQQVWNFDYGQSIYSAVCGSIYQAGPGYLVDFATADNLQAARLVGLDSNHNVAFDFQYNSPIPCGAAWNAIPVPLDAMQIK